MKMFLKIIPAAITVLVTFSCQKEKDDLSSLQLVNDSIKKVYAPDTRVAVYSINLVKKDGKVEITGASDQPQAVIGLQSVLRSRGVAFEDHSVILPDSSVGNTRYAIVNNSVANMRSQGKHAAELATQALLGTVLKVLKLEGDFYLVQTPDGYISWVDHGGVTLVDSEKYLKWINAPKIIFTKPFGYVYQDGEDEMQKAGDIVLGAQLALEEESGTYYKVRYPDQREGYVKKSESEMYEQWVNEVEPSGALMELYAKELMGIPYLWGGTSAKGMDCSGFTKTVFLMNGYIVPRDASQQIMAGKDTDPHLTFENMQKGDLMFFGKKATDSTKQRVTHVGIWLGNQAGEFIHASGRVKLGSVDPDSPLYDEFNTRRYLGSRRYLGETDELIINLKNEMNSSIRS